MNRKIPYWIVGILVFGVLFADEPDIVTLLEAQSRKAYLESVPSAWVYLASEVDRRVLSSERVRILSQDGKVIWVKVLSLQKSQVVKKARSLPAWEDFVAVCKRNSAGSFDHLEKLWRAQNQDDLGLHEDVRCIIPFIALEILGHERQVNELLNSHASIERFLSDAETVESVFDKGTNQ